ncbi:Uncharacterized protein FWK35_00009935 [Aphis craccivora]|uniref:Uncharacterized protein n=1 Tax=Aphis craccivora TaxID=307492 RepID=A0A6G0YSC2_APHCR|nr:Uncharacterized protein FWK35_00009935 [Aphis craccivora]
MENCVNFLLQNLIESYLLSCAVYNMYELLYILQSYYILMLINLLGHISSIIIYSNDRDNTCRYHVLLMKLIRNHLLDQYDLYYQMNSSIEIQSMILNLHIKHILVKGSGRMDVRIACNYYQILFLRGKYNWRDVRTSEMISLIDQWFDLWNTQ